MQPNARLTRLDQELAVERKKDYETLFATHGEHRFKIAIFRSGGTGFAATTKAGGHVHRYNHITPSGAFCKLVNSLKYVVTKLDYERNEAMSKITRAGDAIRFARTGAQKQ